MNLIRKFFVLLSLVTMLAPLACTDDSVHQDQSEASPAVVELLQSIEQVEIAEARGQLLHGATPDAAQIFKRVLTRSKTGAGMLRSDAASVTGLSELVRSRDDLKNLIFLSEDVDVIGIYRTALDKAVKEIAQLQGRNAFDLGDPLVYRSLYSQTFDLSQKLGDFGTFVELKTTRGPKLFEPSTCGEACGKLEFIISDVNKSQAVWLVSPKLGLPDADGLKLTLNGSTKGDVSNTSTKGFRIYASETFTGRFTTADEWIDITAMADRYPANGTSFKTFNITIPMEAFRGKSLSFAVRIQGITGTTTAYQVQNFGISGKGLINRTALNLVAPEPLLLNDDTIPTPGTGGGGQTPTPLPTDQSGAQFDGVQKVCDYGADGMYTISESCRIAFDADNAATSLLRYDNNTTPSADSPFRKFTYSSSTTAATKGYTVTAGASGWRGTGCQLKPGSSALQKGFCAERSSATTWDMLVGPKLKINGNYTVKIFYSVVGPSMNTPGTTGAAPKAINRFRVLAFDDLSAKERMEFVNAGTAKEFVADNTDYDLQLSSYPLVDVIDAGNASLFEATLDKAALAAKIGSGIPFRLAVLQNLLGAQKGSTASYVYAITFKAEN